MEWEWDGVKRADCVVFFNVGEEWGEFSNMHNDFPLRVGGVPVGSSEALYQAMRFPHRPDWQREVLDAPHAMQAKMKAKKEDRRKTGSRLDWEEVQLGVMRWCLRVKLACHYARFGRLLRASRDRPVVERSRKDRFWGAVVEKDGVLRGENWLGRLLAELRDELAATADGQDSKWLKVEPPPVPEFLLLSRPVEVVDMMPHDAGS
jgi:ribA/ribD-fused uncharacterized protein